LGVLFASTGGGRDRRRRDRRDQVHNVRARVTRTSAAFPSGAPERPELRKVAFTRFGLSARGRGKAAERPRDTARGHGAPGHVDPGPTSIAASAPVEANKTPNGAWLLFSYLNYAERLVELLPQGRGAPAEAQASRDAAMAMVTHGTVRETPRLAVRGPPSPAS